MKKLMLFLERTQKIIILAAFLAVLFSVFQVSFAQGIADVVRQTGSQTKLPNFDAGHTEQSYQSGASQLTSIIYYLIDFLTYILGGIATLMIVISGVKLVTSMRTVEEAQRKEKETLSLAFIGLFIVLISNQLVKLVLYGQEGEVFRSASDLQQAAIRGSQLVTGLANMARVAIPVIAVFFIVQAGVKMVVSRGEQEKYNKAKKQINWAVMGLVLAGVAEVLIFRIVFPAQGTRVSDPEAFKRFVITMTNFLAGFISIVCVVMIIYAGYLYVISRGGDLIGKAKKTLTGAIIGLLIALGAFGIVNTFIKVEPLQEANLVQDTTSISSP